MVKGSKTEKDKPADYSKLGPLGIIGVGLLGSAVAERLAGLGCHVLGYEIGEPKTNKIRFSESLKGIVSVCDTLILCLPESRNVNVVLEEVTPDLKGDRHTIIDTTTGNPDEMKLFHERMGKIGVPYVEANVAGSSDAARQGEAPLFLSGDKQIIESRRLLFEAMSKTSFFLGPAGSASKFKLVHNMLLGLNRAVLAETLAFSEALGFDVRKALDVLRQTPAYSNVMDTKGERMVESSFELPQARLSQHLKDVHLILEQAKKNGAKTPLSELHCRLLEELEAAGFGHHDNSAILMAFNKSKS